MPLNTICPLLLPAGLNTPANKRRIAANFSRAADSYDAAATLQQRVATRAMMGLPTALRPARILDLGSGTGRQSAVMAEKYPDADVTALDLALGMLAFARDNAARSGSGEICWCGGDIESLPFKKQTFDLVFSSLAIQWCNLSRVLDEVDKVLNPGGYCVFTSLAKGTMAELDEAWQKTDNHRHVNRFDAFEVQQSTLTHLPFSVVSLQLKSEVVFYPTLMNLLREMKSLGVNTVACAHQGLMTRHRLKRLQLAYELCRTERGLPLTYQVVYGVLKK